MQNARVCVIIAAWNASATIGVAVRSALAEPEVAEVVVVDDASADATADAARSVDDGTGRLKVIRLDVNGGPSRARNVAIAASSSPYLAVLDADDRFLPGRFARIFAVDGWELAADNIVMVAADQTEAASTRTIPDFDPAPQALSLAQFIDGNVPRKSRYRCELGLLKPVISRAFLDLAGLRYDEGVRLGEDFVLYVRLMARGGRFVTIRSCGYHAIQRPDSLSNNHRSADLRNLADASRAILNEERLDAAARALLIQQERLTRAKYRHRQFLDLKSQQGLVAAAGFALQTPRQFWQIATSLAHDKAKPLRRMLSLPSRQVTPPVMRFLLDDRPL